jgi:hypothetical protein
LPPFDEKDIKTLYILKPPEIIVGYNNEFFTKIQVFFV